MQNKEIFSPSQKGLTQIILLISPLLIVGIIIVGYAYFNNQKTKGQASPQVVPENNITSNNNSFQTDKFCQEYKNTNYYNNTHNSGQVLISEVPNFDSIDVFYDLPQFNYDVREVHNYKGNLLISGYGKVLEYNPKDGSTIWQNDNRVLNTINDTALVGDYLYIVNDRSLHNYLNFEGSFSSGSHGRELLKVDIKQRKIEKVCFEDENIKSLVNLQLFQLNNFIWGNSWDGIFRLDPKDDSIIFYTQSEFSNLGKEYSDALNKKEQEINRQLSDFGLDLPKYLSVSSKINDKYYLFSNDMIFTLERDKFPKFYEKTDTFGVPFDSPKVFINSSETFALLVDTSVRFQEKPTIGTSLFVVLVELHSGSSWDLLQDHPFARQSLTKNWEERISKISIDTNSEFKATDNGVSLIESDTKKEILFVNFTDKKMDFR